MGKKTEIKSNEDSKTTGRIILIHLVILVLFFVGMRMYSSFYFGSYDSLRLLFISAVYIVIHALVALMLGIAHSGKIEKTIAFGNYISSVMIVLLGFGLCYFVGNLR